MSKPCSAEVVDQIVGNIVGVAEQKTCDQRTLWFRHGPMPGKHARTESVRNASERRRRTAVRDEIVGRERADSMAPAKSRLVRIEGSEVSHEADAVSGLEHCDAGRG